MFRRLLGLCLIIAAASCGRQAPPSEVQTETRSVTTDTPAPLSAEEMTRTYQKQAIEGALVQFFRHCETGYRYYGRQSRAVAAGLNELNGLRALARPARGREGRVLVTVEADAVRHFAQDQWSTRKAADGRTGAATVATLELNLRDNEWLASNAASPVAEVSAQLDDRAICGSDRSPVQMDVQYVSPPPAQR